MEGGGEAGIRNRDSRIRMGLEFRGTGARNSTCWGIWRGRYRGVAHEHDWVIWVIPIGLDLGRLCVFELLNKSAPMYYLTNYEK